MRWYHQPVTADVPSGSMISTSNARVARGRAAIANDASPPTTTAITVAIAAYTSELRTASHGGTKSRSLPLARAR